MDWLSNILTSKNGLFVLGAVLLIMFFIWRGVRNGTIKFKGHGLSVGFNEISDLERSIVREQCEFTHTYINGLLSKINSMTPELKYNGYFTRWILEIIYDEFVKWINFNHITTDSGYIHAKQIKIISMVYGIDGLQPIFKEPEFKKRMENWVEEVIIEIVNIRKIYIENYEEKKGGK